MVTFEDLESILSESDLALVAFDVMTAGTANYAENVRSLVRGALVLQQSRTTEDLISIQLEREPENPHDPYAIKVYGSWCIDGVIASRHIGYVPKKLAYKIALNIDDDAPLSALFSSMKNNANGGFDILFHIVTPD